MNQARSITAWRNVYMLPSDIKLNIRLGTIGYNNKSLVCDSGFSLGRNDTVNASVPSHRAPILHVPKPKAAHTSAIKFAHEEERVI